MGIAKGGIVVDCPVPLNWANAPVHSVHLSILLRRCLDVDVSMCLELRGCL